MASSRLELAILALGVRLAITRPPDAPTYPPS